MIVNTVWCIEWWDDAFQKWRLWTIDDTRASARRRAGTYGRETGRKTRVRRFFRDKTGGEE